LLVLAKARILHRAVEIKVVTPGIAHPIHLRVGTSDVSLFRDILLNKEYEWELPKVPGVIVDAGANVGFSSIYYANRYPQAKVVCVEPESSNAMMLRKNMAYYPNSLVVEAALWSENGPVSLVDPGLGAWGFRTVPGASHVQGITVDRLMDQCGIRYIDLLKIDIEGAEAEVFADPSRWLGRVGAIAIEPHDRFRAGCSRSLFLATPDFSVKRKGEMVFLARTGTVPPLPSSMHSTVN
jgi:FkbM family methyltransferase